jgi:HSP20 family protein
VDNLFNLAFGRINGSSGDGSQWLEAWFPAVDVYEDENNLLVKAELPGLKKENIKISFEDRVLTLSGERKNDEGRKDADVYRSERYVGEFHRSVSVPCDVQVHKIEASYNEGVLTVTLPKAEEAKPKQIQITVK